MSIQRHQWKSKENNGKSIQVHRNEKKINDDLDENWSIVAEAIQTILRRENFSNPYEALKALTRTNSIITRKTIHSFIDSLDLNQEVKKELKSITPFKYTGIK